MTASKLQGYLDGCTNVRINDFSTDVGQIDSGIIFFYCTWSPTFIQLQALVSSLKYWFPIPLFIFDTEEEGVLAFMEKQDMLSHGWGETYWIKNGKVISFLQKYNSSDMVSLVENNKRTVV